MESNTMRLYENKVYGVEVSAYGLENGYLDYLTLSKIIGDCILNNTIREQTMEDWEMVNCDFTEMVVTKRGLKQYIHTSCWYEMIKEKRPYDGRMYV